MLNTLSNILFSEATTEGKNIMDILDTTDDTAEITMYIVDAIYILVIVVICLAFFTALLYLYKYLKNRKNPNYKKDDDFLDG